MNSNLLSAHIGQYAFIQDKGKKLLVLKRNVTKKWTLPGGRVDVEDQYDWKKALLREVREETGLEVLKARPINICITKSPRQIKYNVFFKTLCKSSNKIILSSEHIDYKWISLKQIESQEFEREIIKEIINNYLEKKFIHVL